MLLTHTFFSPRTKKVFIVVTDSESDDNEGVGANPESDVYDADTEEDDESPGVPEEDDVSRGVPEEQDDAASSSSEADDFEAHPELLGRICAVASTPDIPAASVGHGTLALCTKEGPRGASGFAIVSSATVVNENPGIEIDSGNLFLTNAAVQNCQRPMDLSPDTMHQFFTEVTTDDCDKLELYQFPRWYTDYLMAIWNTDPGKNRIGMISDAIAPIQAGTGHLDFGVNQSQEQFERLVDAVGTHELCRVPVYHTQCDACRNVRHCTFKLGTMFIGSDCANRIRAATPAVKMAHRLAHEIPLPFNFRFMIEGLIE